MVTSAGMHLQGVASFVNGTILQRFNWPQLSQAAEYFFAFDKQEADVTFLVFPGMVHEAVGGSLERAIPLSASWILLHLASQLFDDLQDQDAKPSLWRNWSDIDLVNVGLGAIFAGQACLSHLRPTAHDATAVADILQLFTEAGLLAAHAQATEQQIVTINDYFQNLMQKASILFSVGAQAGVWLHTADTQLRHTFHEFGLAIGALTQIQDDLRDILPQNQANDLLAYRRTLPVLHGLAQTTHPNYPQLAQLLHEKHALSQNDLATIYQTLIDMGSLDFCASIMYVYRQKAENALSTLEARNSLLLTKYVHSLLAPIFQPPHSIS